VGEVGAPGVAEQEHAHARERSMGAGPRLRVLTASRRVA
jgi:hypothetical protein